MIGWLPTFLIEEHIEYFSIADLERMYKFVDKYIRENEYLYQKGWYGIYTKSVDAQDIFGRENHSLRMVLNAEIWNRQIEREHIYEQRRNRKLAKDTLLSK